MLISLIFQFVQTNVVHSNDFGPCLTPNGHYGQCVFLSLCEELDMLQQKHHLTKDDESFLSQSECRNVDTVEVVVCCRSENPIHIHLPTYPECGAVDGSHNRIKSDNITKIWEYPWMALLLYSNPQEPPINGCDGALINKRYVLTAAHCVSPIRKYRKRYILSTVRFGEWDTTTSIDIDEDGVKGDPVVDVGIEENIVHEFYDRSIKGAYNDIALLRLSRTVEYTPYIKPICIHRENELLNKDIATVKMFAAGWSQIENVTISNKKLTVGLFGESVEKCQEKYTPHKIVLKDTQLCAEGKEGIDTCIGYSGGTLVMLDISTKPVHFHAVGILSFGPMPCGLQNFPEVYTKVFKYVTWIESKLRL